MKTRRSPFILVFILVVTLGCTITGGGGSTGSATDPTLGLEDLPTYRASLAYSFAGTQGGEPSNWSQTYSMTSVKDPETRLMEYSETGFDPEWTAYPALSGFQDNIVYTRTASTDRCTASYAGTGYDTSWLVEPASKLLKVNKLTGKGEEEIVAGIQTRKYDLDASAVTDISPAEGSGAVWLAEEGDYIVKYILELTGNEELFGEGMTGTLKWEYQLELLDPSDGSILPVDCPLPLPDLPMMGDASDVIDYPGYLDYTTGSSSDEVIALYRGVLPGDGYSEVGETVISEASSHISFASDKQEILIYLESGNLTRVMISGKSSLASTPSPTFEPVATVSGSDPQVRVLNAIDKLVGGGSTVPAFPSYHMEYNISAPVWSGGIVQSTQQISADVEGRDVHFIDVSSGTRSEVYIIDDQEYEVVGGSVSPGLGLASLSWSMWYIDPVMIISIGSLDTTLAGTESMEGRTVEVYEISGSSADDTSGYMSGLGVNLTRTAGTMWVDQETGGLIKAIFEYDEDIKDDSGTVKGNATGHFEIVVTQIGEVTVMLP